MRMRRATDLATANFWRGMSSRWWTSWKKSRIWIVLDPPRDGIHPKAIGKILNFGVSHMVYVSCKPTSLARDLEPIQAAGYQVDKVCCVDMFPHTANCETVVSLTRKK